MREDPQRRRMQDDRMPHGQFGQLVGMLLATGRLVEQTQSRVPGPLPHAMVHLPGSGVECV